MKRILVYIQTLVRDIKIVNTNSVGRFLMLGETIYFTCVGLFAHSLQITGRNCFKLFLEAAFRNYFFKIGLLKNFAIFRVKHFCWGLFLIKKDSAQVFIWPLCFCKKQRLTHSISLAFFITPWKHRKTSDFLIFSMGTEREQWHTMG